jgi:hypothetical protein
MYCVLAALAIPRGLLMSDIAIKSGGVSLDVGAIGEATARLRARRRRETVFIGLGIASTLIGVVTLAALLIDLGVTEIPRLSWDFFTSFPSRRASQAGILSA